MGEKNFLKEVLLPHAPSFQELSIKEDKMKKLFTAIQKNDYSAVTTLLDRLPELINCVHQGSPKKYDGQSPLQVALKIADCKMVRLLLAYNPDVNFMEGEPCANMWRAPVLHDAINRAIMSARWNINRSDVLEVFNSKEQADEGFNILKFMLEKGADVNAKDSYGNAGMDRACLQARQISPRANDHDRVWTEELQSDIARIFYLLKQHGADMGYIAPNAFGKTYAEQYGGESFGFLLR